MFQGLRVCAPKVREAPGQPRPVPSPSCTRSRSSTTSRPPKTASTPGSGQGLGRPPGLLSPPPAAAQRRGLARASVSLEGPASQGASRSLYTGVGRGQRRQHPQERRAGCSPRTHASQTVGSLKRQTPGLTGGRHPRGHRTAQRPAVRGNTTQPTQGTKTTS